VTRTPTIDAANLDAHDRAVYDAIAGPRGGLGGPFAAWFVVPDIAERVNALVDRLRFASKLDPRIFELTALVVAHERKAPFVWGAHTKHAAKAGISEGVIAAIEADALPPFTTDDERAAFEFIRTLMREHHVGDELYARADAIFGAAQLVELVTVAGYYTMNAMINGAFDVS
jgi:4-carboxymuconolactone decarboxylase